MLAHSFKSYQDLHILGHEKDALIQVLYLLENGDIKHQKEDAKKGKKKSNLPLFNMGIWEDTNSCGTTCCIGGTAQWRDTCGFPSDNKAI
jgi:hypothetical protein